MDCPIFIIDQLPQQLRALRKSRGWSQAELARRLGVSQTRVATIERNPSVVSVGQLFEMLQLLDATLVIRERQAPRSLSPSLSGPVPTGNAARTAPSGQHPADDQPKGEW